MCQEPPRANIVKVIELTSFFPRFLDDATNEALMAGISKNELETMIKYFQKRKSLNPNGWPVEFI